MAGRTFFSSCRDLFVALLQSDAPTARLRLLACGKDQKNAVQIHQALHFSTMASSRFAMGQCIGAIRMWGALWAARVEVIV